MSFTTDDDGVIVGHFVRNPYNYDRNMASIAAGTMAAGKNRTQQQFRDEVDINTIVRRFGLTGELPENLRVPQSGEFEDVVDFQSALNIVRSAEESFMQLPAEVRRRFNNNPQMLQEFVENRDNLDEARRLGIAVPAPIAPPAPTPMPVRVIADPPKAD